MHSVRRARHGCELGRRDFESPLPPAALHVLCFLECDQSSLFLDQKRLRLLLEMFVEIFQLSFDPILRRSALQDFFLHFQSAHGMCSMHVFLMLPYCLFRNLAQSSLICSVFSLNLSSYSNLISSFSCASGVRLMDVGTGAPDSSLCPVLPRRMGVTPSFSILMRGSVVPLLIPALLAFLLSCLKVSFFFATFAYINQTIRSARVILLRTDIASIV